MQRGDFLQVEDKLQPLIFVIQVNKDCKFCGFQIFGSTSPDQKAAITSIILYQGDCQVYPEDILFEHDQQIDISFNYRNKIQRIQFNQKPVIKKRQIYTLSLQIEGEELFQADPSTFKLSIDQNGFNVQILETQNIQQIGKESWRKEGPLISILIKDSQN